MTTDALFDTPATHPEPVLPGRLGFSVSGVPVPQGSKVKNRYGAIYDSNKALQPWRVAVTEAAEAARTEAGHQQWLGPVRLIVVFRFARPGSHYGTGRNAGTLRGGAPRLWHAQTPDADKCLRAVCDALTFAGVWRDDRQVADLTVHKVWAQTPGADIAVEPLP